MDSEGFLLDDPRGRAWIKIAEPHVEESLVADESCVCELSLDFFIFLSNVFQFKGLEPRG